MKKILLLFTLLLLAAPNWAQTFTALSEEGVEITFQVVDENEKLCITMPGSEGQEACIPLTTKGKVTIPEVVEGYTVWGIGDCSFACCSELGEVVIPESVCLIDMSAFTQCYSLTKVNIPENVFEIGERAFMTTNLQEVTIGSDESDAEVYIGDQAFAGCGYLKKVTLKDNVTVIGGHAFESCESLEQLFIPKNVSSIGFYAFRACTGLQSIVVDEENVTFDSRDNCNAIIQTEQNWLRQGCNNTVIPETVEFIEASAFQYLAFTSLYIPKSVRTIDGNPWVGCPLETITVDPENQWYDARDNCNAIIETAHDRLFVGCKNTVIPSTVKDIEFEAFRGCAGIVEAVIPEGVRYIARRAFLNLPDLERVVLPSTLTLIDDPYAFAFNMKLEAVVSYIKEPFPISDYTFITSHEQLVGWNTAGNIKNITLYVPQGTKEAYQTTEGWCMFSNIVEMEDTEVAGVDAGRQVVSVRYHDLSGRAGERPFPGVNIVITTYDDGTTQCEKSLY